MSFATKYQCKFNDIAGLGYEIDFQWDGYTGAINPMQAAGDPIKISYLVNGDDVHQNPIHGTRIELTIIATASFQYADFFSITDIQIKTLVYAGGNLIFSGWVLAKSYTEPYNDVPYNVTITAIDGLAALKSILFDITDEIIIDGAITTPAVYYTGRMLESEIILDILGKIGATTFTEIVNIYETNIPSDVSSSPMNRIKIDVSLWNGKFCYDVLADILIKWDAIIRQYNGIFYIFRPDEMTTTFYARTFTAPNVYTATSGNYVQNINRATTSSQMLNVNGATLSFFAPAKILRLMQDYGDKKSWIDNWDLKGSSYSLVGYAGFQSWTSVGPCDVVIPSKAGVDESDGMMIISHNSGTGLTKYQTQTFGSYAIPTAQTLQISMDYAFFNELSGTVYGFYIYVEIICGGYYLYTLNTYSCGWSGTRTGIQLYCDAAIQGWTSWVTYSRTVQSLPFAGPLTIKIYALPNGTTNNIFPVIKNIQFTSTNDVISTMRNNAALRGLNLLINVYHVIGWFSNLFLKIHNISNAPRVLADPDNIVQKEYDISNAITGDDISFGFNLGDVVDSSIDNVLEQFAGALSYIIPAVLPTSAVPEIDSFVVYSWTYGHVNLNCNGSATVPLNYNSSIAHSLDVFVSSNKAYFATFGITLTVNHDYGDGYDALIFIGTMPGSAYAFSPSLTVTPYSTDMSYLASIDQYAADGSAGSPEQIYPTAVWNSRGRSEAINLLQLIGGRLGHQFSRLRQWFTGFPVYDRYVSDNGLHVNPIGVFVDDLLVDQADFFPQINGNTKTIDSSWDTYNCTIALNGNYLRYTTTTTNSSLIKQGAFSLEGNISRIISIRYRVVSGTPGTGQIYYSTAGHGRSAYYYKSRPALIADGQFHCLLMDMSVLDAGGTDWTSNTITKIWFDLTDNNPVVIDIDWIGFNRFFIMNAGTYSAKNRFWNIDLIEVVR